MVSAENKKHHQAIIIWDWDDTLNASTFLSPLNTQILNKNVRKKLPKEAARLLSKFENIVIQLLQKSVSYGTTYIITNAGAGWVELSSSRFQPKLYKSLIKHSKQNGLNIVSARTLFEREYPSKYFKIFIHIFLQMLSRNGSLRLSTEYPNSLKKTLLPI